MEQPVNITRDSLNIDQQTEVNIQKLYIGDLNADYNNYYNEAIIKSEPNYKAKVYAMECIKLAAIPKHYWKNDLYYNLSGINMFINLFIKRIKPEPQNGRSYIDQFIADFNETMNYINNGIYSSNDIFDDRKYPEEVNQLTIQQLRLLYNYAHEKDPEDKVDDNVAIIFFAQNILNSIIEVDTMLIYESMKPMFNFESNLKAELDKLYPSAVPKPKTFLQKCFGKGCMSHGGRTRGGRTRGRRGTKKTRKHQRRSKRA